MTQCSLTGALDHRSVRHRIAERNAQFNHIRPGFNGGESDVPRGRKIGIAAREVGDQRRLVFKGKWHGMYDTVSAGSIQLQALPQNPYIFVAAPRNVHNHHVRFLHFGCALDRFRHCVQIPAL